jgi:hypothetical protein
LPARRLAGGGFADDQAYYEKEERYGEAAGGYA